MNNFSSTINTTRENGLIINKDFKKFLNDNQLNSFESIWKNQNGETIKNIKPRSVIRLEISDGSDCTLYIKKHKIQFIGLRGILKRCLRREGVSQGYLEYKNICDFRDKNLATVIPVVAGEKFYSFFWVRSFLITQDFFPFISLESLLEQYPDFFKGPRGDIIKSLLLTRIALLAKKMHKSGFNHRDFNATHILLHYRPRSFIPNLALFDLQRVERRGILQFRWMIKSLARLNYTLPNNIFNNQGRMNILLTYRGKRQMNFLDRLLWYCIQKKTKRIKKHTERKYNKN